MLKLHRMTRDSTPLAANRDEELASSSAGLLVPDCWPQGDKNAGCKGRIEPGRAKVAVPWGLEEVVDIVLEVLRPVESRRICARLRATNAPGATSGEIL